MTQKGRRDLYKPSKDLLAQMLCYMDRRAIADLCCLSTSAIGHYCIIYGLNGNEFKMFRTKNKGKAISEDIFETFDAERKEYREHVRRIKEEKERIEHERR